MKLFRFFAFCVGALLLLAPTLRAQDLAKYRGFSIGMSVNNVLKLSDQKLEDVKTIHARPMLIQELTWWPPGTSGHSPQYDNVEQILFSFSNGELYKISVTYDRSSTVGMTEPDMVESISAKYGPATNVESEIDPAMNALYNMKPGPLASWKDSKYSFDLVRTQYSDHFGLVIYSQQVNANVELATAESVKLEEQERPEKEASEKKKEADDLAATREKNQKSFRP
jgi:ribonuclease HI